MKVALALRTPSIFCALFELGSVIFIIRFEACVSVTTRGRFRE
jgi:hypothetical protein